MTYSLPTSADCVALLSRRVFDDGVDSTTVFFVIVRALRRCHIEVHEGDVDFLAWLSPEEEWSVRSPTAGGHGHTTGQITRGLLQQNQAVLVTLV